MDDSVPVGDESGGDEPPVDYDVPGLNGVVRMWASEALFDKAKAPGPDQRLFAVAAVVFACAELEARAGHDAGRGKDFFEGIRRRAEAEGLPVEPDLLVWMRGAFQLRHAIVHASHPRPDKQELIRQAGLPVDFEALTVETMTDFEARFKQASGLLFQTTFRALCRRWSNTPDVEVELSP